MPHTPSLLDATITKNSLQSSSSSSPHSWKSIFRIGSSSSKKSSKSTLTLDTGFVDSVSNTPPLTPGSYLGQTPASSTMYFDGRYSSNSSGTLSSDSVGAPGTPRRHRSPPHMRNVTQPNSPTPLESPATTLDTPQHSHSLSKSSSRSKLKPDKQRGSSILTSASSSRRTQTANSSQQSFAVPPVSAGIGNSAYRPPPTSGSLSPKGMTRFIRRVASAPNAKLFGSRPSHTPTMTLNGLLAPALNEGVPPVPGLIQSASSEQGTDSLETVSSGSSTDRKPRRQPSSPHLHPPPVNRPGRANSSVSMFSGRPGSSPLNGVPERPGKAAFRRTYSSNSIKVKSVWLPLLYLKVT